MFTILFDVLLFLTSLFLILLVLVQRGKGGGLAGALGGVGGYSAFGTRAGDMFTKITIGVAAVWLILAVVTVKFHASGGSLYTGRKASSPAAQGPPTKGLPEGEATEEANPLGTGSGSDMPLLGQDNAPDSQPQPQTAPEPAGKKTSDSEP